MTTLPPPPVSFAARGNSGILIPPKAPPKKSYGEYCWRASCSVTGAEPGIYTGYDVNIGVSDTTLNACRVHAPRGSSCAEPQLVLLPGARKQCTGQIFFMTLDGKSRKIF